MTYGKTDKKNKAPRVGNSNTKGNYFKESDLKSNRKSAQQPLKQKRLSK